MSINELSELQIEELHYLYETLCEFYGNDLLTASPKKQKKAAKFARKQLVSSEMVLDEKVEKAMTHVFGSDRELIALLENCHRRHEEILSEWETQFDEAASTLSPDLADALKALLRGGYLQIEKSEQKGELVFFVDQNEAFSRVLHLKSNTILPTEENMIYIISARLFRDEKAGCFVLRFVLDALENNMDDMPESFSVTFSEGFVEKHIFDCTEVSFGLDTSWDYLGHIAAALCEKSRVLPESLNERETELLPLASELSALYDADSHETDFAELSVLAEGFGYKTIVKDLKKLSEITDETKFALTAEVYRSAFSDRTYEPLWRELFGRFLLSQEEYPTRADLHVGEEAETARKTVTAMLTAEGYEGEYPDFVRVGSLRGVRLAKAYDTDFFVTPEKRVAFHIHCREVGEGEEFGIVFFCGTHLLKKNEDAGDIYTCMQNGRGRRFINTVSYLPDQSYGLKVELSHCVSAAVKRAELKPLTKAERENIMDFHIGGFGVLFWSLLAGIPFALLFCLFIMIFGSVFLLCTGDAELVPALFTDVPWGWCFLFCAAGYGIPFGLIQFFQSRK